MPVYHIFVINRAGSLIYSYDNAPKTQQQEKTFSFPLEFKLALIDQKPTVVFGERDGIRVGHILIAINGQSIFNGRIRVEVDDPQEESGKRFLSIRGSFLSDSIEFEAYSIRFEADVYSSDWLEDVDVLTYLSESERFPCNLAFTRPSLSANEKIILSSMFHSIHAIGAQLSPAEKSSGINSMETKTFRLESFQTRTGNKFVVATDPENTSMEPFLKKLYELYADYALKNPFYSLDMPIRCELFDNALSSLLEKYEKLGMVNA